MTAKEKAKELFDKFEENTMLRLVADLTTTPEEIHMHNKLCALISVDAIIPVAKSVDMLNTTALLLSGEDASFVKYWQSVKAEIEKL